MTQNIVTLLCGKGSEAVQVQDGDQFRLCGLRDGVVIPLAFVRDEAMEGVRIVGALRMTRANENLKET